MISKRYDGSAVIESSAWLLADSCIAVAFIFVACTKNTGEQAGTGKQRQGHHCNSSIPGGQHPLPGEEIRDDAFCSFRLSIRVSRAASSSSRLSTVLLRCILQSNRRRSRIRQQPVQGRSSRRRCGERRHHFNPCILGLRPLHRRTSKIIVIVS